MKKTLFLGIVGLFLLAACQQDVPEEAGFGGITKTQCEKAGGYWNECGSPCTGTDAEMCIQMCQVQCECAGLAGFSCPEGFKCRLTDKIADEMGVCIPG